MVSQINPQSPNKTLINITPSMQDKVVDHVLIQSGGIGFGIFVSLIAFVVTIKFLGAGRLFDRFMDSIQKGADSLNNLTGSINDVSKELDINHQKYVNDHQVIMEKIEQVKTIIKEDVIDVIESIERKLNK